MPVILAYVRSPAGRRHAGCFVLLRGKHAWLMIQSSSLSLATLRLSMQDALRAICLMASTLCYLVLYLMYGSKGLRMSCVSRRSALQRRMYNCRLQLA